MWIGSLEPLHSEPTDVFWISKVIPRNSKALAMRDGETEGGDVSPESRGRGDVSSESGGQPHR